MPMKWSHVKLMSWLNILLCYSLLFSPCSYPNNTQSTQKLVMFPGNALGEESLFRKGGEKGDLAAASLF